MYMSMYEEVRGISDLQELGLQAAVSCLVWMPDVEPRSPARIICALNH